MANRKFIHLSFPKRQPYFRLFRACRWQFQICLRNWQRVLQMGRIHCGRRRNCSLCRHVKIGMCLWRFKKKYILLQMASHNYAWTSFSLNPFPNKPRFLRVCSTSPLKTLWEKEKLLVTSNFSFSQCFLPVWRTFCHFRQIWNCCLQMLSIWTSLKFFVWERVKTLKW